MALLGAWLAVGILGVQPVTLAAAPTAQAAKPAISPEASAALLRMGQTLSAKEFSFQANTIRVYSDTGGDLVHIFHTLKVVVDRPNHLLADSVGDDGSTKIVFDGKIAYVYSPQQKNMRRYRFPKARSRGC